MSRGNGRIQRDLVAALESRDKLVDTFQLTAEVYRLEPNDEGVIMLNDAMLVSVRRALVKLAAERKIFKVMRGHNKRAYWANERLGLWYTVREMRRQTMALSQTGDIEAARTHADRLLPLINRAHELGIDINQSSFSRRA
ncbi:hypothetical protein [Bradyrhizobium sp. USDA 10063]